MFNPLRLGLADRTIRRLSVCYWASYGLALTLYVVGLTASLGVRAETDPLTSAQALLARLNEQAPTSEFVRVAHEFGTSVDGARQGNAPDAVLLQLREVAKSMRGRTETRLRGIEVAAGSDEGALEQIYRSATWDDLNFALSAFPYWQAWLELTLADRPAQKAHHDKYLYAAKHGFRAAAMQIFQPNLVYGGWLGMGFMAKANGEEPRAIQIFEGLKKSLAADPKNPVYKVADAELSILHGKVPPEMAAGAVAGEDAETANLHAEAMMLLAQHRAGTHGRETGVGARQAAEKIRRIIDSGHMTMALLGDMLGYAPELAREGLGSYTELLLAEFNFNNQQWLTAIQKYHEFFMQQLRAPGMDFERFHYRHAVALLKSNINEDAAREAEKLLRGGTEPAVQQAATKLAYIARARNAEVNINAASRNALVTAAKRFVAQSPGDQDADGARLILAQQSGEPGAALRYLDSVKSTGQFAGGVEKTRYYVLAKDFAEATQTGKGLEGIAQQALAAWKALPKEDKESPQNQAFYYQLLAVTDPAPAQYLQRLMVQEQKVSGQSVTLKRAYLWCRLETYERLHQPERLLADIQARGNVPAESWQLEQYYPFLHRQSDVHLRLSLAAALAPQLKKLPEMERRIRLQQIDDRLLVGQGETAYTEATSLIKDFPHAGDAYRALAHAAQATKRFIEADNAWRIITEKVPPKQDVWWEGMLSRIDIRAGSTRPAAACELVTTVAKRLPAPKADFTAQFAALRKRVSCPAL